MKNLYDFGENIKFTASKTKVNQRQLPPINTVKNKKKCLEPIKPKPIVGRNSSFSKNKINKKF